MAGRRQGTGACLRGAGYSWSLDQEGRVPPRRSFHHTEGVIGWKAGIRGPGQGDVALVPSGKSLDLGLSSLGFDGVGG